MRRRPGDEPLTLKRCHRYMKNMKAGSLYVAIKGIERKFSFFSCLLASLIYFRSFHAMIRDVPVVY